MNPSVFNGQQLPTQFPLPLQPFPQHFLPGTAPIYPQGQLLVRQGVIYTDSQFSTMPYEQSAIFHPSSIPIDQQNEWQSQPLYPASSSTHQMQLVAEGAQTTVDRGGHIQYIRVESPELKQALAAAEAQAAAAEARAAAAEAVLAAEAPVAEAPPPQSDQQFNSFIDSLYDLFSHLTSALGISDLAKPNTGDNPQDKAKIAQDAMISIREGLNKKELQNKQNTDALAVAEQSKLDAEARATTTEADARVAVAQAQREAEAKVVAAEQAKSDAEQAKRDAEDRAAAAEARASAAEQAQATAEQAKSAAEARAASLPAEASLATADQAKREAEDRAATAEADARVAVAQAQREAEAKVAAAERATRAAEARVAAAEQAQAATQREAEVAAQRGAEAALTAEQDQLRHQLAAAEARATVITSKFNGLATRFLLKNNRDLFSAAKVKTAKNKEKETKFYSLAYKAVLTDVRNKNRKANEAFDAAEARASATEVALVPAQRDANARANTAEAAIQTEIDNYKRRPSSSPQAPTATKFNALLRKEFNDPYVKRGELKVTIKQSGIKCSFIFKKGSGVKANTSEKEIGEKIDSLAREFGKTKKGFDFYDIRRFLLERHVEIMQNEIGPKIYITGLFRSKCEEKNSQSR